MSAIKNCPFCGHYDVTVYEGSTFRWRYAECDRCGAKAPEVRHDTLADDQEDATNKSTLAAIGAWNERSE